jgi:hypothetical protein
MLGSHHLHAAFLALLVEVTKVPWVLMVHKGIFDMQVYFIVIIVPNAPFQIANACKLKSRSFAIYLDVFLFTVMRYSCLF